MAESYGCAHYKRKCALICASCNNQYTCRLCHDDKEEHKIDRNAVTSIVCLQCNTRQKVQQSCEKCSVCFGTYFCANCRLYDDVDKKQFHCDGCGVCRVGGRENYFHCTRCDICLPVSMETHKCVEKSSRDNCPVCLEDLHSSIDPCRIIRCGHLAHSNCFDALLKNGNYTCPRCNKSMVDLNWGQLDEEIAHTAMPADYSDYHVQILCNDCNTESRVLFHILGLKCVHCGSYNTCRAREVGNGENGR